MKKLLIILGLLFIFSSEVSCNPVELPLKGGNSWFDQPIAGVQVKEDNWFKVVLWRSSKWRTNYYWRYEPQITHRYYYDCSYYKYVNCGDMRFGRCWQCRYYQYKFEYQD